VERTLLELGVTGYERAKETAPGSIGWDRMGALAEEVRGFGLVEWWNKAFTESERQRLEQIYAPLARLENHPFIIPFQSGRQLLEGLVWTIRVPADEELAQKVREKVEKLTDPAEPGLYRGRHFTTYVNEVKGMIREGRIEEGEHVLLALVGATEKEARIEGRGVAYWYYERLASIYRGRGDYASEVAILTRYSEQQGEKRVPGDIQRRLERARMLLAKVNDSPVKKRGRV